VTIVEVILFVDVILLVDVVCATNRFIYFLISDKVEIVKNKNKNRYYTLTLFSYSNE
jgi:hypothetical protein